MRTLSILLGILIFAAAVAALNAAPRAVIAIGLTAGELATKRLEDQAELVRHAFVARGFSPDQIMVVGPRPPLKRDELLRAISATSADTEETWIVLLGTVAPGRDGTAAFQISGPRLSAGDFATAIAALPGRKYVMVATSLAAGLLRPLLALPDIEAVAATREAGEVNEPFFAEAWALALQADPQADFPTLARTATQKVAQHYAELNLAQPEHAQRLDAPLHVLVDASTAATTEPADNRGPTAGQRAPASVANLQIPTVPSEEDTTRLAATDETKTILGEARAQAAGSPFDAIILRREIAVIVEASGNAVETHQSRTYVCRGAALDNVATLQFPPPSPNRAFQLRAARIIRPDASQILLRPRRVGLMDRDTQTRGPGGNENMIQLPEVAVDCVVEISWSVESRPDGQTPGFYQEWIAASPYPVLSHHFECSYPSDQSWHWLAQNGTTAPRLETAPGSKVSKLIWDAANVSAFEPLPGDPALRSWRPWIAVSATDTWKEFESWYRRLTADAMSAGPATKTLAKEISDSTNVRSVRLRLAYERVAALRYVAIELGVGALRPRTPDQVLLRRFGDCKDKANLLVALLRSIGINAEFALINRSDATFVEFPGWQFNHAIVRVPADPSAGQAQDLWLDATDRLVPFGVMSPGIVGRSALVFPEKSDSAFATVSSSIEAPAEWEESWEFATAQNDRQKTRVELRAVGAADTELRRAFAGVPPASRTLRLQQLIAASHPALSVESVQLGDPFDLTTEFTVRGEVTLLGTNPLCPSPPEFAALFANPTRNRPLWIYEGRPWLYRQKQKLAATTATPALALPINKEIAGIVFSARREGSWNIAEVRLPGRPLNPTAYPEIRAAWQQFRSTPIFVPTQP